MATLLAPPTITDATRREFLTLLGAAGLLTGCGAGLAPDAASPGTRPFTDSLGRTVDIPARPARIVSLQAYTSGQALLSVGAPVIGMEEENPGEWGVHVTGYDLSDITPIGTFSQIDVETIARLAPDLIVGYAYQGTFPQGDPETFQRIAPMVALDETLPLDEFMTAIGTITGLDDVVATQRRDYETAVEALRTRLAATAPS